MPLSPIARRKTRLKAAPFPIDLFSAQDTVTCPPGKPTTCRTKTSSRQKGFTLPELMVVLAILTIVAAIGTTTLLSSLPTLRLKSTARDIFSTMMQAKAQALRRGENVTVSFDAARKTYTMTSGGAPLTAPTPLPPQVIFGPAVNDMGLSFTETPLVFSSRGIPLNAGHVHLQAIDSHGNILRQRTVDVTFAGRINMN